MRNAKFSIGRSLACLLLVGLVVRALVPAGFMVGAVSDGWPIIYCPGQSHGPLFASPTQGEHGAAEHHGEHGGHAEDDCESECFLGYAFTEIAEIDAIGPVSVELGVVSRLVPAEDRRERIRHVESPRTRGPPSTVSISA